MIGAAQWKEMFDKAKEKDVEYEELMRPAAAF